MNKTFEQELLEQSTPEPFTNAETERILALAKQKMAQEETASHTASRQFRRTTTTAQHAIVIAKHKDALTVPVVQGGTHTRHKHLPRRALCIAAVVATMATLCGFGFLTSMSAGEISFFDKESTSLAQAGVTAPKGNVIATQGTLETYNATIGKSITQEGVTLTYDTIAVDGSQINLFYTLQSEKLTGDWTNAFGDPEGYEPKWLGIEWAAPYVVCTVTDSNGQSCTMDGDNTTSAYRADATSFRIWNQFALPIALQGDLTVQFHFEFPAELEISNSSAFDDALSIDESALVNVITVPAQPLTFGERECQIANMTFDKLGGAITVPVMDEILEANETSHTIDLFSLAISDSTGAHLFSTVESKGYAEVGGMLYETYLYSTISDGATSVTFTPVHGGENFAWKTLSTQSLADGVQLETSPIGGYTVQNFKQEGGIISYELVPYGYNAMSGDLLFWAQGDEVSLTESGHSALISRTVDTKTGTLTERIDYYAATEEEVANITTWKYQYFSDLAYDEANAATLPLS